VHRTALRRDSGGAGTHRGGLGLVREYEILSGEVRFTHRGERHFIAPKAAPAGAPAPWRAPSFTAWTAAKKWCRRSS
jgi:N-methylhydantoinase B/oxoprolinase/acetone carboxylase alpha subunit